MSVVVVSSVRCGRERRRRQVTRGLDQLTSVGIVRGREVGRGRDGQVRAGLGGELVLGVLFARVVAVLLRTQRIFESVEEVALRLRTVAFATLLLRYARVQRRPTAR